MFCSGCDTTHVIPHPPPLNSFYYSNVIILLTALPYFCMYLRELQPVFHYTV